MGNLVLKSLLVLAVAMLVFVGCGKDNGENGGSGDGKGMTIMGEGATFPFPLYDTMFKKYHDAKKIKVNYQSKGSGAGINALIEKMVNFGATDAPMKQEELDKAGAAIIHIPTTLGAVAVTYNLDGNPTLKLTGEVLADIYMLKITKWNDAKITALNPGVSLPDASITVVRRGEKSGTTFIFTDYLSTVSKTFEKEIGRSKMPEWPEGTLGAKGNPQVTATVKQTVGAIGYVGLEYALEQKLPVAEIKNKSGNYIAPTTESVSLAANTDIPDSTMVSLVDTAAEKGYPISSFTWLILYTEQNYKKEMTLEQAKATLELINWMITDAQVECKPLNYAPLPEAAKEKAIALLKSVTFDGKKVME